MYVTKVGELLMPGKTRYQEGAYFEYDKAGPVLILALSQPTEREIYAARKGVVEFALYESPPAIFLLHKIQGLEQWSDSPFSIRLYERKPPIKNTGIFFIALVDADTGILKAQRLVSTSIEFANELRAAIMRQYEKPFSKAEYDRKIDEMYRKHTSKELLSFAVARHQAGREEK
jgi:hypothetical protein